MATADILTPEFTSPDATALAAPREPIGALSTYLVLGALFGIVITKAQVISWFRIQEMFRFQSFHMYGIMATAMATASLGLCIIRRLNLRTSSGELVSVPAKVLGSGTRYWLGGIIFGLGWALIGACPGPLLALLGGGVSVFSVAIASALLGTWSYGVLRPHLPH
jgi:uncharacterized protein